LESVDFKEPAVDFVDADLDDLFFGPLVVIQHGLAALDVEVIDEFLPVTLNCLHDLPIVVVKKVLVVLEASQNLVGHLHRLVEYVIYVIRFFLEILLVNRFQGLPPYDVHHRHQVSLASHETKTGFGDPLQGLRKTLGYLV